MSNMTTTETNAPRVIHVAHPGIVSVESGRAIQYIGFVQLCRSNGLDPQSPDVLNAAFRDLDARLQREQSAEVRHYSPEGACSK